MKIGIKEYFVFCLIICLFYSCKKRYEEGPLISFQSPCKRIGNRWELEYLFIGGVDSTLYMNGVSDSGYSFSAFNIPSKDGSYNPCGHNDLTVEFNYRGNPSESLIGSLKIGDKEKTIKLRVRDINQLKQRGIRPIGPFFNEDNPEFKIKRLTKKELWLDIMYKGNYCWAHFKN
jgi:hypothetical protein